MGWDDDFSKFRDKLLAGGMADVVASVRSQLDSDEARQKEVLHCGTAQAAPGCEVTIRYLYQVLRGLPREQVFAQILLGFELTKADPRFVGFNLVMPEDYYVPMHDFDLHMRIIEALHKFYPAAHVSLHADELAMGLVPPEGLRFHIRESIERGGAERIGHGVAVMSEDDPIGLLREMAKKNVLVEICLTSNDVILGVSGDRHPLPVYMKYGVPVALATDDEGVSRSDMTHEYLRAVETYGLSYAD
jgi:adenosine deaminase